LICHFDVSRILETSKRRLTRRASEVQGAAVDEIRFRESRLCRLLGNPVIYQLVLFLDGAGPLTPSKLAMASGRSVQTISGHLAKLRAADLVRH
jgi:hypothetical protein